MVKVWVVSVVFVNNVYKVISIVTVYKQCIQSDFNRFRL
jgi:hypothetical protein